MTPMIPSPSALSLPLSKDWCELWVSGEGAAEFTGKRLLVNPMCPQPSPPLPPVTGPSADQKENGTELLDHLLPGLRSLEALRPAGQLDSGLRVTSASD
jgi:hypothetical protein